MGFLDYVIPIIAVSLAGYFLYKKYRNTYQKAKCGSCSSYGSCNKIYKVEIEDK